ncbi:MAG: bifunctional 23S rRNA (guanine(2069)-N(7))-methyltransferase RlmK/23S rRNA (guanine(2445)-N(2))-methyltransferase RlmL [Pseudomonadales bacterium]|nr:bifunctional 23S rRNA (guanine(2069)-N(7))-methyltransferase RlmK/23S rRNA (guanine(2445)-N(2))-methyltransferase RlmL [Pseudomonadales bacterium]
MPSHPFTLFATCPRGLEGLLKTELEQLGAQASRETLAGLHFQADLAGLYRICLWSRLASRVLLPLTSCPGESISGIYHACYEFPWEAQISPDSSLLVDFNGSNAAIGNTRFGAQKVKDALVDRMRNLCGRRPQVDKGDPDIRIHANLQKGQLKIGLDLGGGSLGNRGYLMQHSRDALKNNLAAALLIRAGWPDLHRHKAPLIDPLCERGTLLIEAALMAGDIAPGLYRSRFGFEKWLKHEPELWQQVRAEAVLRRQRGLERMPSITGYCEAPAAFSQARDSIKSAGLDKVINLHEKALASIPAPAPGTATGLLISCFPYVEEADEQTRLAASYREFGQKFKNDFPGWHAALLTGNPGLARHLNIQARKKYHLHQGPIPSQLLCFISSPDYFYQREAEPEHKPESTVPDLSEGALMFSNRIHKNLKKFAKWRKKNAISCYRLYDADMPEYAVAVDIYGDYAHVQEYAAPKKIDAEKARRRFQEIQAVLPLALGIPAQNIAWKERRPQKGKSQYEKLHKPEPGIWKQSSTAALIPVNEGRARLLINLHDYLDVGLFLDHRPLRLKIAEMAPKKRFLNLFCYTATATVHAALGGASSSVSVDMSKTYLDWADQNFALNAINTRQHRLVRADCLQWLKSCDERFDLILLDPPSFSNSKKMADVLDVQQDHVSLIRQCMALLARHGSLFFSTNLRSFKLDAEALSTYSVKNISAETLDRDFEQNRKIHQCWLLRANKVEKPSSP